MRDSFFFFLANGMLQSFTFKLRSDYHYWVSLLLKSSSADSPLLFWNVQLMTWCKIKPLEFPDWDVLGLHWSFNTVFSCGMKHCFWANLAIVQIWIIHYLQNVSVPWVHSRGGLWSALPCLTFWWKISAPWLLDPDQAP